MCPIVMVQLTRIAVSHSTDSTKITLRCVLRKSGQINGLFIKFFGEERMLQASNLY